MTSPRDIFYIYDEPVPFRRFDGDTPLMIYPVSMRQYYLFNYCAQCLTLERTAIKDPLEAMRAISMSYLEYLYTVGEDSPVDQDNVIGYLAGGFEAWKNAGKEMDTVNRITAEQFKAELKVGESTVLDVRRDSEYSAEHVEEAFSRPLAEINIWFSSIDDSKPFYMHCAGGYRSMIAASILKARGIHNFKEIEGGFKAIAEAGVPKTDFVCQSKLIKS